MHSHPGFSLQAEHLVWTEPKYSRLSLRVPLDAVECGVPTAVSVSRSDLASSDPLRLNWHTKPIPSPLCCSNHTPHLALFFTYVSIDCKFWLLSPLICSTPKYPLSTTNHSSPFLGTEPAHQIISTTRLHNSL
jgi:hypothetical protein